MRFTHRVAEGISVSVCMWVRDRPDVSLRLIMLAHGQSYLLKLECEEVCAATQTADPSAFRSPKTRNTPQIVPFPKN